MVNPTRSKVKKGNHGSLRERSRAARPRLAGRPHEAVGNGSPRWMTVAPRKRAHRTRPTGRLTLPSIVVACDGYAVGASAGTFGAHRQPGRNLACRATVRLAETGVRLVILPGDHFFEPVE